MAGGWVAPREKSTVAATVDASVGQMVAQLGDVMVGWMVARMEQQTAGM